jgi:hypothetical protein
LLIVTTHARIVVRDRPSVDPGTPGFSAAC